MDNLVTLAPVLGWAGVGVGVAAQYPQAWRSLCSKDTTGVSLTSSTLGAAATGVWLVYALMLGDMVQLVNYACTLVAAVAVVVLLLVHPAGKETPSEKSTAYAPCVPLLPQQRNYDNRVVPRAVPVGVSSANRATVPALSVVGVAMLGVVVWWVWGTLGLATFAATLSIVRLLPQVKTVLTAQNARAVRGVSPLAALLFLVGGVIWSAYGVLMAETALTVTSALSVLLAGVILWRRMQLEAAPSFPSGRVLPSNAPLPELLGI